MGKRKVNPRLIPKTLADVEKAYKDGIDFGVKNATALFFLTLLDKEHADAEILQRVWKEVEEINQDVIDGVVKISDVRDVLKREYGINIV